MGMAVEMAASLRHGKNSNPKSGKDSVMLPFSPLRIWGMGIISWVILGAGAYCIWAWADHARYAADPVVTFAQPSNDRESNDIVERRVPVEHWSHIGRGWPLLAAGLGLLAWSLGGFFPTAWLLSKSGGESPRTAQIGHVVVVERPDGTRLHLETFGPKSGPTLIFTHGWSLDSTCWGYQLRDLSSQFRIVLWDLPGLGQSKGPKNGDYSLEKMAHDLEAVAQHSGKGPVILVGHSIGGMITQTFCRLYPKQLGTRVAGIVLLHTTYTNPLRTAFMARFLSAIEKPVLIPLNYLTMWLAPLAWLSNMQSYWNGSLHIMTRFASFAGGQTRSQVEYGAWLAATAWPGVVARGNLAMLSFDEQRTLPAVDIPVLVIASQHDRMTKPDASLRIEESLPKGLLATVPAGHLGFWEQRAKVSELLIEFADRFRESRSDAAVKILKGA
jgi:pimeloyl-ACP methyl ester carboxylesterase